MDNTTRRLLLSSADLPLRPFLYYANAEVLKAARASAKEI